MVFITAGMGGAWDRRGACDRAGRAQKVFSRWARHQAFHFEGDKRMVAERGISANHVDTLIVIPIKNLFRVATSTTFAQALCG
jgi:cell division GTPase FtsZ